MAWKQSQSGWVLGVCALVLFLAHAPCSGDSITANGVVYEEVLVYEGSSSFYVKIPAEGRTISVPVGEVDRSTVVINDDPYYRDELKDRYEDAKLKGDRSRRGSGPTAPSDPAFQITDADRKFGSGARSGSDGGGGGGKGLGYSRAEIQGLIAQQGYTFKGSGDVVTGRSPDTPQGSSTIQLGGPANNLTSIIITFTGTQQLISMGIQGSVVMAMRSAPWAGEWAQQNNSKLLQGQPIQKTQDGIFISIQVGQSGQKLTATFTMRAV